MPPFKMKMQSKSLRYALLISAIAVPAIVIGISARRAYVRAQSPWLTRPMLRCALAYGFRTQFQPNGHGPGSTTLALPDRDSYYAFYGRQTASVKHAIMFESPDHAAVYWIGGDINYGAVELVRDSGGTWHATDDEAPLPENPLWLLWVHDHNAVPFTVSFPTTWYYQGKIVQANSYEEVLRLTGRT